MDWNGDGLEDLLVGEYDGHIRYFMAVTADSLTQMEDLKAAGVFIDGGLVGCPLVFDWNNDSLNDLLVGFSSPDSGGCMKLYMNIGTPTDPVLDEAVNVFFGGAPLMEFGCTPSLGDLNDDGLSDIVFGEAGGNVYYSQNIGTASSPVFAAQEALETASGPINLDLNSAPVLADWNDDGFIDLVTGCGEAGYIWVCLSPDTQGINGSWMDNAFLSVSILSNPVAGYVSVSVLTEEAGSVHATLYSISGRLINDLGYRETAAGENTLSFTLPDMETGMYLMRVASERGHGTVLFTVLEGI